MKEYQDKVFPSIRYALNLMEEISSNLSGETCKISTYKKILLCRMETQYSIALLKLSIDPYYNPPKKRGDSKVEAGEIVQLLKSSLAAKSPEEALEALYQADSSLGKLIQIIRRKLRSNSNRG